MISCKRPACAALALALIAWAAPTSSLAASAAAAKLRKVAIAEDGNEFANFTQWKDVSAFLDRMAAEHQFDRAALESLFNQVRYVESTVRLIKPAPPGKPKNWKAYRARFIDPVRIRAGVEFWETHAQALAQAEEKYGVPAEIIVGIIGVETVYGRNTGNFRVVDALTTLAFDYPQTPNRDARMHFFRGELENTLLYARDAGIDPFSLFGSYAGAIGWPQFMPGSIRRYAVDFDGDGRIDLRNSPVDAIGSVANFLVEHGWKSGEPVVFPATIAATESTRAWEMFLGQGLEAKYRLEELQAAGVQSNPGTPPEILFGLVDLQNGDAPTEYWLGAGNFFAITKYNRSFFYAMSVIDLGREVRRARGR
ncbi:MAG TPA: lytic murein transglycosylase B [Noviherbaspirillum sp.]|uniref:lytic murein transglycosylase B n=1 Tax=Noviherbaspirillum sp. TaxID=1926288 RepID=UPI002F94977A